MKKLHRDIIICIILLNTFVSSSPAQDQIIESQAISNMMEAFIQRNQNIEKISAWRIQIKAFTDRREMEEEKFRFERSFPYYSLEWEHDDPYYILKLKNRYFLRKLNALYVLNQIKEKYPYSILTREQIPTADLLNSLVF